MTTMKSRLLTIFAIVFTASYPASVYAEKQAVKHMDLPDITSYEEAVRVFNETTMELRKKSKLDEAELHEIHIITYSLEKAIAYFSVHMKDEQQDHAKKMAELVELVHIGSENNRVAETGAYLQEYFQLADPYSDVL